MNLTPADISAIRLVVNDCLRAAGVVPEPEPKEEPLPTHVTQTQLARLLGVTPSAVHKRISRGKLKVNGAGRIPASEARKLIEIKARRKTNS